MPAHSSSPPFRGHAFVAVVVPRELAHLDEAGRRSLADVAAVLERSAGALARELGAPIRMVERDPGAGARWLVGPSACNPDLARLGLAPAVAPEIALDRERGLLVCDAPTADGIWETFSMLRSLARFEGGVLAVADCGTVDEAVARIVAEVGDCYPSFELRGLDWAEICALHAERMRSAPDPIVAAQEWLAELRDAHTWVRPASPLGDLPYDVWNDGRSARLAHVPRGSAGWAAGARPGYVLLGEDTEGWWRRTAASPHARALLAGRWLLQAPKGTARDLVAESPDGRRVSWPEIVPARRWERVVARERLPSGAGYLRVRAWFEGEGIAEAVDAAFDEFEASGRLVVDLRGNPGGSLSLACAFRDRFLREPSVVGSIRYSEGPGMLSESEPIVAEPAAERDRWKGRVRFLTDPLTYSSAEDALLGLQGLPHVEVVGEPSGGGSGRMRSLRLLEGWRLTVSTALTYDRAGRCVEGAGIPVDRPVAQDRSSVDDAVLRAADAGW